MIVHESYAPSLPTFIIVHDSLQAYEHWVFWLNKTLIIILWVIASTYKAMLVFLCECCILLRISQIVVHESCLWYLNNCKNTLSFLQHSPIGNVKLFFSKNILRFECLFQFEIKNLLILRRKNFFSLISDVWKISQKN